MRHRNRRRLFCLWSVRGCRGNGNGGGYGIIRRRRDVAAVLTLVGGRISLLLRWCLRLWPWLLVRLVSLAIICWRHGIGRHRRRRDVQQRRQRKRERILSREICETKGRQLRRVVALAVLVEAGRVVLERRRQRVGRLLR